MKKVILLTAIFFFISSTDALSYYFFTRYRNPSPDWTYPKNRKYYKGYKMKEERVKKSFDWKYATNRPGGNTKGGGRTNYYQYQSWYDNTKKPYK